MPNRILNASATGIVSEDEGSEILKENETLPSKNA
jgi:hypothetical protein